MTRRQLALEITYGNTSVLSRRTPTGSDTSYAATTVAVTPASYQPNLNQYGGSLDLPGATATGRFYVTTINNKKWLIDPLGNRFISIGVNSVNVQATPASQANAVAKYGDTTDNWATGANTELKSMGFNTVGAWSTYSYLSKPANNKTVYTVLGYFMRDYGKSPVHTANYPGTVTSGSGNDVYSDGVIYVFEPEFTTFAQTRAQEIYNQYGNDSYFLGVMSDNELPLSIVSAGSASVLDRNLAMNNTADPMYYAVRAWLESRGIGAPYTAITDKDRADWVGYIYGEYTRIIKQAIMSVDPAMLYLGSRLHQKSTIESPATFSEAYQYLDVVSLNYYNYWEPDANKLTEALGDLPFIITEFYTKALSAVDVYGNTFGNTSGAGWCVATDQDRATFYQNFVLGILRHRNGVGWHWFRYTDNDPQSDIADPSNVDANKGLYSLEYQPYDALSMAARAINRAVYTIVNDQTYTTPDSSTVQWWLTNAGQTQLFSEQSALAWSPFTGTYGTRPLIVDDTITYQTMLGFGAAATDAATSVVQSMPHAAKSVLMHELFAVSGLHMDVLRLPMGASDFARSSYTYHDTPGNASLAQFSIAVDEQYTIPFIKEAMRYNPNLTIIASPWSAPAWMKSNNSLNAGSLLEAQYATYAAYFVKFIEAYQAHGIDIYAVTVQNEPLHTTPSYPSMSMSAAAQSTFIANHLGPAFVAAGISTKILAYDHNWDDISYANTVLSSSAAPYVSGSAWHAYAGEVTAQQTIKTAFPDKDIYFTEITASQPGNFGEDLKWYMRNIGIGAPQNWARTSLYWNIALNQANGPINGGYTSGQGIVRVDQSTQMVTRYSTYYGMKHVSHGILPGAVRIGCSSYGTGFVHANVFRNQDGSYVAHILCDAGSAQTFRLIHDNRFISLTLQPGDVVTCIWR